MTGRLQYFVHRFISSANSGFILVFKE